MMRKFIFASVLLFPGIAAAHTNKWLITVKNETTNKVSKYAFKHADKIPGIPCGLNIGERVKAGEGTMQIGIIGCAIGENTTVEVPAMCSDIVDPVRSTFRIHYNNRDISITFGCE